MEGDVFYRVDGITFAPPLDEWEHPLGDGRSDVTISKFRVVKRTPKGVWVVHEWDYAEDDKRFVLLDARKRYACPTLAEAIVSFRARKKRQLSILANQTRRIDDMLRALDRLEEKVHA